MELNILAVPLSHLWWNSLSSFTSSFALEWNTSIFKDMGTWEDMHSCISFFQYVLIFCTCCFSFNLKEESNNSYKISVQLSPLLKDKIDTLPVSCLAFNSRRISGFRPQSPWNLHENVFSGSQFLSINEILQSPSLGYKQSFKQFLPVTFLGYEPDSTERSLMDWKDKDNNMVAMSTGMTKLLDNFQYLSK